MTIMNKGIESEYLVMADLIKNNVVPCTPVTHITPYDLIAVDNLNPIKIQVKSGSFVNGKMIIHFRKSNGASRRYTSEEVDVIAVCDRVSKRVGYIPFEDTTRITLYEEQPDSMNGIKKGTKIRVFNEFEDWSKAATFVKSNKIIEAV